VVGLALGGDAVALELVAIERFDDRRPAEIVLEASVQACDSLAD
jgi:hypothetical protein